MNGTGPERQPDTRSDTPLTPDMPKRSGFNAKATWRSGYAADCKSVYAGSIPAVASNDLDRNAARPTLTAEAAREGFVR
jgi:hypothetical protein